MTVTPPKGDEQSKQEAGSHPLVGRAPPPLELNSRQTPCPSPTLGVPEALIGSACYTTRMLSLFQSVYRVRNSELTVDHLGMQKGAGPLRTGPLLVHLGLFKEQLGGVNQLSAIAALAATTAAVETAEPRPSVTT